MIKIELADGQPFNPNGADVPSAPQPTPPRTLVVVANELEAAISASLRVPALREELDALMGRKKRGPRKGA